MAQRLFRTVVLAMLTIALLAPSPSRAENQKDLRSTIAFVSTRDTSTPTIADLGPALEIYLMNEDGTDPRRLTDNEHGDAFPVISPDGKKIVFESNQRAGGNTSDLFVMNTDGTDETFLTRGSSATWSPDSKYIAFHASASGNGQVLAPIQPGSATSDSDIFVTNVDDCLVLVEVSEQLDPCHEEGSITRNLTNNEAATIIDEDADWSPDGQQIVFTRHTSAAAYQAPPAGDRTSAEIYVMKADGTGDATNLTKNNRDERAPAWSPDGDRIVFSCRPPRESGQPLRPLELCVIRADGTDLRQLTDTRVFHGTPVWSPAGDKIVFVTRPGDALTNELRMLDLTVDPSVETALTNPGDPGINWMPSWGMVRLPGQSDGQVAVGSNDRSADTARGPAVDGGTGKDGTANQGKQGKANKGKNDNDKKDNKGKKNKKHKGGGKGHGKRRR